MKRHMRVVAGAKRRKRRALKRGGSNTGHLRDSVAAKRQPKMVRLANELDAALEQRAAASEVLRAISGSSFDLQNVLDRLVEAAMHLCDAELGKYLASEWRCVGAVGELWALKRV